MEYWKVLVVDADPDVHAVTALALRRLEYRGRSVVLFEARSAAEARSVISVHPDMSVVLLDIAQETETDGLDFIKWLRKVRKNEIVQIVARMGQPGREIEDRLTIEYEINDYQEKAELTARKIRTSMITALRAFDALSTIDSQRNDLKQVIEASAHVFRNSGLADFERETLSSLGSVLHGSEGEARHSGVFASRSPDEVVPRVTTATGRFKYVEGKKLPEIFNPVMYEKILAHDYSKSHLSLGNFRIYGFRIRDGSEVFIILEDSNASSTWKQDLLETFRLNLGVAVENFHLYRGVESARNELVFALGEVAESRSEETGNHVKRVAEIACILGLGTGMGEFEAEQLRLAASLHDLGKLTIPDEILAKAGSLSSPEFESMKSHALVGFEMLKSSSREIIRSAAQIALEHHENWDGTGYPRGLKGTEIGLYSRIVAIADVFDALGNRRVYKEAWEIPDILEYMYRETGRKFDPQLMEIFFARWEELGAVRTRFPD